MRITKRQQAIKLLAEGTLSHQAIAQKLGIQPEALSRWMEEPRFLNEFRKHLSLAQCRELETIHRLVQRTYEEFLQRLSDDAIKEVSTLHLMQVMEKLHRRLKQIQDQLDRLASREESVEPAEGLLSEEEYRELAAQVLATLAKRSARS